MGTWTYTFVSERSSKIIYTACIIGFINKINISWVTSLKAFLHHLYLKEKKRFILNPLMSLEWRSTINAPVIPFALTLLLIFTAGIRMSTEWLLQLLMPFSIYSAKMKNLLDFYEFFTISLHKQVFLTYFLDFTLFTFVWTILTFKYYQMACIDQYYNHQPFLAT